jgi:hypothetical protein
MIKRIFLILILLLLIGSITFGAEDTTVLFNNNLIDLVHNPYQVDGDFMVPMIDIFEQIGVQYSIDYSDDIITAYHNNMFLKYYIGSKTYYLNGKGFYTHHAPILAEEVLYLPLSTITDALNIASTYDTERNLLILNNYSIKIYKTYTNYFYNNVEIPKFNVSFDIPYYWELLDDSSQTYGFQSDFENSQVTCYAINATESLTIDSYVESLDIYLKTLYPDGYMATLDRSEYVSSGLRGIYTSYVHSYLEENIVLGYYITQSDDVFYIFTFTYNQEDSSYLETIVDNIINSFEIKSFAVDTEEEHYIEYPKFYTLETKPSDEYYSNKLYRDTIVLRGSIDAETDHLNVNVSKNQEALKFIIPISNGIFNGEVFLPFGLGKHNITISIDSDSDSDELFDPDLVDLIVESNILMRFSAINISPSFIRYTIPDDGIISNHEHIQTMGKFLSYDLPTNYAKAYNIYTYMMENVSIRSELDSSDPYQVYLNLEGTQQGVTYYFASLLRNIGIPTRVYQGIQNLKIHYWTEIYLNGSWSVVDPASGISVSPSVDSNNFFLIRPENYRIQYEQIYEITK